MEDVKKKEWCVYILKCSDGSLYTGVTNDVQSRMKAHRTGHGSKYVHAKGFSELLYTKSCKSRSDALKCEIYIKKLPKNQKIEWFLM